LYTETSILRTHKIMPRILDEIVSLEFGFWTFNEDMVLGDVGW
jgi:hypothetical protein